MALYDCPPWRESYVKHKEKEGKAIQEVPETSTSILIGATPESARFSALETRDAMRWRFNYYTSESFGRMIAWPLSYDSCELSEFTGALEGLKDLKGEIRLIPEAFELWKQLQSENRRKIEAVSGIDSASETYGSVLAFSPANLEAGDDLRGLPLAQRQDEGLAAHPGGYLGAGGQARGLLRRGKQKSRRDCKSRRDPGRSGCHPGADPQRQVRATAARRAFLPDAHTVDEPVGGKSGPPPWSDDSGAALLYSTIIPDLTKRRLAKAPEKRGKLEVFLFRGDGE